MSIALACNVYQDAAALRGLLESGSRYFDNIFILHTGPNGARSTDGTIELCESFGIKPVFDDISRGFGRIRTRLIHDCGCDWAMIMDADERFFPQIEVMTCEGTDRYPKVDHPNLKITKKPELINQGADLKEKMRNPMTMAIRATRRHWFDFTMTKPTENWQLIWDHQLRIVRNKPHIRYTLSMHERLMDEVTGETPNHTEQDPIGGPFYDHFHMFFRKAQPGHKDWNEKNYERLSRGEKMLVR